MVQQIAQNPAVQDELQALEAARDFRAVSVRDRAEEEAISALNSIIETFEDPTVKPADRIKAAKLTLELAGYGSSSATRAQRNVNVIFTSDDVSRELQSQKARTRQVQNEAPD